MKVVVDANAFFAALLKGSLSRRLFFRSELTLFAPEFIIVELIKNARELRDKYRSGEDFDHLVDLLLKQVRLVTDEELRPYGAAAKVLSPDEKDELYLACALYANAVLWSNDKRLKIQRRVKVQDTTELATELGLL